MNNNNKYNRAHFSTVLMFLFPYRHSTCPATLDDVFQTATALVLDEDSEDTLGWQVEEGGDGERCVSQGGWLKASG